MNNNKLFFRNWLHIFFFLEEKVEEHVRLSETSLLVLISSTSLLACFIEKEFIKFIINGQLLRAIPIITYLCIKNTSWVKDTFFGTIPNMTEVTQYLKIL